MPADPNDPPLVAMHDITIGFPGVLALDGVDFVLRRGEVHALMGENGAGKSTLIKALTGVYSVDQGTITVAGEERSFGSTADAQHAGISTVYQEVNLCNNLSVGENVMLGHEPRGRLGIDWKATHREAAGHLENLGLHLDTHSLLSSHSIAVQQLVAISRSMVLDARVLVLDEPTSSLDRDEVEQLRSLYVSPTVFAKQVKDDSDFYQRALQSAALPLVGGDPVASVFLRFDDDLDIADAAGDLGLTPADLERDITLLNPVLQVLRGGTVDRDDFTAKYIESLCDLLGSSENAPDEAVCDAFE